MISIDGASGEGGGQILRSSLALSLVTSQPFRIERIRFGRKKPGLLRQHLTAVKAAAEIGKARVYGDELGSQTLQFEPHAIEAGEFHFSVGTAGSATLVLQAVLPPLMIAERQTALVLEGGTHNPHAPPFDFLAKAFLPIVNRMGPSVAATLEKPGFFPAGGGRFNVEITPAKSLSRVELLERGRVLSKEATAIISRLPSHIAQRELKVVKRQLSWPDQNLKVEKVTHSDGPGNALVAVIESENVTEVFTAFGSRGVTSEKVAAGVVKTVLEYLEAGVPVGRFLADQLMLPMALAGGGELITLSPSQHSKTSMEVIKEFLDVEVSVKQIDRLKWQVKIGSSPDRTDRPKRSPNDNRKPGL